MYCRREGTAIKEEIYRYIARYISKHVYPPSYKEIADELNISAKTVKKHMDELVADGILRQMRSRERKERSGSKIQR